MRGGALDPDPRLAVRDRERGRAAEQPEVAPHGARPGGRRLAELALARVDVPRAPAVGRDVAEPARRDHPRIDHLAAGVADPPQLGRRVARPGRDDPVPDRDRAGAAVRAGHDRDAREVCRTRARGSAPRPRAARRWRTASWRCRSRACRRRRSRPRPAPRRSASRRAGRPARDRSSRRRGSSPDRSASPVALATAWSITNSCGPAATMSTPLSASWRRAVERGARRQVAERRLSRRARRSWPAA